MKSLYIISCLLLSTVYACTGNLDRADVTRRQNEKDTDEGQDGDPADNDNGGGDGGGGAEALTFFTANVIPALQTNCASCHANTNVVDGPDFLGTGGTAGYHQAILNHPNTLLGNTPDNSLLLIKGVHTGPAFLTADAAKVSEWIRKQKGTVTDPNNGGGGGGDTSGKPQNAVAALERFGACMQLADFQAQTNGRTAAQVYQQQTDQGNCASCHAAGAYGALLSSNAQTTLDAWRHRPYLLKLMTHTVESNGAFKGLAVNPRFKDKGIEAEACDAGQDTCHPVYELDANRQAALDEFLKRTLDRYNNPAIDCGPLPPLP